MLSASLHESPTCSQRAEGDFPKSLAWAGFVSMLSINQISALGIHRDVGPMVPCVIGKYLAVDTSEPECLKVINKYFKI